MSCLAKEEIIVLQCKYKKEKKNVCNVIWWEMGWGWGIPPPMWLVIRFYILTTL
jgi:hypothetical protein